MPDISTITLPDNTVCNFRDSRVDDLDSYYVLKSGDIMTGDLSITDDSAALNLRSSELSSTIAENVPDVGTTLGTVTYFDKNWDVCGVSDVYLNTSDQLRKGSRITRKNASGTTINHGFYLTIDSSGNRGVEFTNTDSKTAWQTALEIPVVQSTVSPSAVSVATASDTTLCNTGSLTGGYHYLILATASFPNNNTGRRVMFLATSTSGSPIDRYCQHVFAPVSGVATQSQLIYLCNPSSNTTYYLRVYQNSGSALNVTGGLRVFKFL